MLVLIASDFLSDDKEWFNFCLEPVVFILVAVHPLLCVQKLSLESTETILKVLLAVIFYFTSPPFFSQSWAVAVADPPSTVWQHFPCSALSKLERETSSNGRIWFSLAFCARVPLKPEQLPQPALLYPLEAASCSLCSELPWAPPATCRAVGFLC